jgi:hypothetical protein
MVGPGSLLLVAPQICSSNYSFIIVGVAKKKSAKLKRLVLLSKMTYRAPVEMLSEAS